jgi:hypothetical protein
VAPGGLATPGAASPSDRALKRPVCAGEDKAVTPSELPDPQQARGVLGAAEVPSEEPHPLPGTRRLLADVGRALALARTSAPPLRLRRLGL